MLAGASHAKQISDAVRPGTRRRLQMFDEVWLCHWDPDL